MAVTLEELLDPKRAEREEGWHGFTQDFQDNLAALSVAIEKLSGKRSLGEGESIFTVLEQFVKEQNAQAELEREKTQRLREIAEASIPAVTAEQQAAYRAQKELYEQYQHDLKTQTQAVVDAQKAQTDAIAKAASGQIKSLEKQAVALKDRQGAWDSVGQAAAGSASQMAGKGTPLAAILEKASGKFGAAKAEKDAQVDSLLQADKAVVEAEKLARIAAIKEESEARIKAIEAEVKAQMKASGVEKAPVAPEEARAAQVESATKAMASNKALMRQANKAPVVAKQQQEFREELALEAREEAVAKERGEYLAPAVAEDALPGEAAKPIELPVAKPAAPKPNAAPVADVTPAPAASAPASPGGGALPVAKPAGGSELSSALGQIGKLGEVGNVIAKNIGVVGTILMGINDAVPVITKGLGAIGDASRALGPILLGGVMQFAGYYVQALVGVRDAIVGAMSLTDTRVEQLRANGTISDAEKTLAKQDEARHAESEARATGKIGVEYGGVSRGRLKQVERTYTDPVQAAKATEPKEQAAPTTAAAPAVQEDPTTKKLLETFVAQGNGTTYVNTAFPQLKTSG